jgi:hypothetical protein
LGLGTSCGDSPGPSRYYRTEFHNVLGLPVDYPHGRRLRVACVVPELAAEVTSRSSNISGLIRARIGFYLCGCNSDGDSGGDDNSNGDKAAWLTDAGTILLRAGNDGVMSDRSAQPGGADGELRSIS